MKYVCPDCGYESENPGDCPECGTTLLKREDEGEEPEEEKFGEVSEFEEEDDGEW